MKLPIDIIVQPQARASDVPLAMGYDRGRCKLVLSLRGNPQAEAVFAGIPEDSQGELIEAMAAHEIAHCWRHAQGSWNALPAGFTEVGEETASDGSLLAVARALRESRREEAYADLAALAWTRHNNPQAYPRVHGWLATVQGRADAARRPRHPRLGGAGARRRAFRRGRCALRRTRRRSGARACCRIDRQCMYGIFGKCSVSHR